MSRSTKLSLAFFGLLFVGSLPMLSGCVRSYYEQHKVATGMTVPMVFSALDRWNLCITSYSDEHKQWFAGFNAAKEPGEELYRVAKYHKTLTSKAEFVQFVSQQMNNGKAWGSQFTYYAGPVRNTFRVDFDASGKVTNVSEMAVRP